MVVSQVTVREMQPEDELFVASCSHVRETEEWDRSARRRIRWQREMRDQGLRIWVSLLNGEIVGHLYAMPIEICPMDLSGRELLAMPCISVVSRGKGKGAGSALMAAAEEEAVSQGLKGLVTIAYYHDFWFMPAPFFEQCGYSPIQRRETRALMWKRLASSAEEPEFLERNYEFEPVSDKVAVDLFWTRSCLTSDTEAERVREVTAEFGDAVTLREYCTDDPAVRDRYGIIRAIFVDGREIGWGYEAPRDGIREAIREALDRGAGA